ncbi:energy transducer TonB [Flavobacterium lindanitolerans]|jgi:protein TonB|uniref:energy transducer TonB n=1 Tax=Flavobacterium lindanitolerans TaxID=428988 RepID=UPI0023F10429|nr:energy transducer TonB [Flavobacterium lindanitolerans]
MDNWVKQVFILLVLLFLSSDVRSQELLMDTEDVYGAEISQYPEFPGGMEEFFNFFNKEFKAQNSKTENKNLVSFNVEPDGSIKKIKLLQFSDIETGEEIIRVLKMSPKWKPAMKNGKAISVEMKIPIVFTSHR